MATANPLATIRRLSKLPPPPGCETCQACGDVLRIEDVRRHHTECTQRLEPWMAEKTEQEALTFLIETTTGCSGWRANHAARAVVAFLEAVVNRDNG